MIRARRCGLPVAAFLCAPLVGCSALLDLGPEATLRDASTTDMPDGDTTDTSADSNVPAESGLPDAEGPMETGPKCGLTPAPNATCNMCNEAWCCANGIACARNPRCAEGMAKLLDCVYDTTCVGSIDHDYADAGVVQYQACVINHCAAQCFPGPRCSALARCCKQIAQDELAAKQTCIGAVNTLDDMTCDNILNNTLRPQLGAQFCGGTAPADGGAD